MASDNKNWAQEYVSGPLHEPTPAEETGLNASFVAPAQTATGTGNSQTKIPAQVTGSSIETNPFRRGRNSTGGSTGGSIIASPVSTTTPEKNGASTHIRSISSGTPRRSASNTPSKNPFTTGEEQIDFDSASLRRSGSARTSQGPPSASSNRNHGIANRPRRSSSLREKFPGDPSVHPLDQLTRENRRAAQSPHLKKKHHHGSDSIDKLDDSFLGGYHHEGPYDAASLARNNTKSTYAPVGALKDSIAETLKATPQESVRDSVERHRPLDNVASIPSGERDAMGRQYQYRDGLEEDMMRNGPNPYKRWDGIQYVESDLKGKGEPSYTIERGLKDSSHLRGEDQDGAVELVERPRGGHRRNGSADADADATGKASGHRRVISEGGITGLKKRMGSLRRNNK